MRDECDIIRTCLENEQITEEVLNRFGWKATSSGKWEFMGAEGKPAVDGRAYDRQSRVSWKEPRTLKSKETVHFFFFARATTDPAASTVAGDFCAEIRVFLSAIYLLYPLYLGSQGNGGARQSFRRIIAGDGHPSFTGLGASVDDGPLRFCPPFGARC